MAITNENFNNVDYVKASGKRIITCTSDKIGTSGVFNYRFLLEVMYGGTTLSYTFRPNNNNYGIININKILQTFVESAPDVMSSDTVPELETSGSTVTDFKQNIHTMPTQVGGTSALKYFSFLNGKTITCKLFDFYGATADAVPSKQTSGSKEGKLVVIGGISKQSDLINVDYSKYKLVDNKAIFLNNNYNFDGVRYNINVALSDWGTIAFFNKNSEVNNSQNAKTLKVEYYNASGTSLVSFVITDVISDSGSSVPISAVGIYPANLEKHPTAGQKPSNNSTLAYYDVIAVDNTSTVKSDIFRFHIVTPCEKYDRQRFAFINSLGVWEYIAFDELRTDNLSSKPTYLKGSILNYDEDYTDKFTANGVAYREKAYVPNVAHRGEKIVATNYSETFTVNTGFLDNPDVEKIKDLFLSDKISYINADGSARAVILETSSINAINNINKHYEQVSYSLTFRYSVPTYNDIIF